MFNDKKIFVLGFARSGYSVSLELLKRGCTVVLNDIKEEKEHDSKKIEELRNLGCILELGNKIDIDDSFDYLIKNPGINSDHYLVKMATNLNIPVMNEVEVGFLLLEGRAKIIAITGSNGKTTTTSITYNILKEEYGEKVHLAGNIGYPLTSVINDIKKDDILVMEVSCQQLANLEYFKPDIALLTNLSPAHIDFFKTYDKYKETKIKLFKNQNNNDYAIINYDNIDSYSYNDQIKGNKLYFSIKNKKDAYYENNKFYYKGEFIMDRDLMFLKGNHNVENALAAIIISKLMNVSNDNIVKVLKNFRGVEHRLEYVDSVNDAVFYNDTEATNIKCTQIALASFKEPTVIFLGGLERGQNFDELTPFIKNVKLILGIGECRERVREFGLKNNIKTIIYEHLKDSFIEMIKYLEKGDIVLLSPASASWDQYKECEVRGKEFKELVSEYKNGSFKK